MRKIKIISATGLVAGVLVLWGCGDGADSAPETSVVPDLVGVRLDVAEERLQGLPLGFQALGPRGPVVSELASWEVCRTNPGEGLELPANTRIELVVARSGRC